MISRAFWLLAVSVLSVNFHWPFLSGHTTSNSVAVQLNRLEWCAKMKGKQSTCCSVLAGQLRWMGFKLESIMPYIYLDGHLHPRNSLVSNSHYFQLILVWIFLDHR